MTDKTRYDGSILHNRHDRRPPSPFYRYGHHHQLHALSEGIRTYNTWVSNRNVLIRKLNKERRGKNLPCSGETLSPAPGQTGFSEGIMQVYLNYHKLLFPSGRDHLQEGLDLYQPGATGSMISRRAVVRPGGRAPLCGARQAGRGVALSGGCQGRRPPAVWGGVLEKRRKDPVPAAEQQWLFAFSRQLDAYRNRMCGAAALREGPAGVSHAFPDLADRTNVFPGDGSVAGGCPATASLAGRTARLAEVPAVYAGAYRQHLAPTPGCGMWSSVGIAFPGGRAAAGGPVAGG
jgi:hypothetical protein